MKSVIILVFTASLLGCIHEEDQPAKANPTASQDVDFKRNSAGFPDVPGKYAVATDRISMSCSDGAKDSNVPLSFNIYVIQADNEITLSSTNKDESPDEFATVIQRATVEGLISKTGSFSLFGHAIIDMKVIPGLQDVFYYYNGQFTLDGWSGSYKWEVYFRDYIITCEYTTTFSGDKISAELPKT